MIVDFYLVVNGAVAYLVMVTAAWPADLQGADMRDG
jgi:hypothetical protein